MVHKPCVDSSQTFISFASQVTSPLVVGFWLGNGSLALDNNIVANYIVANECGGSKNVGDKNGTDKSRIELGRW